MKWIHCWALSSGGVPAAAAVDSEVHAVTTPAVSHSRLSFILLFAWAQLLFKPAFLPYQKRFQFYLEQN